LYGVRLTWRLAVLYKTLNKWQRLRAGTPVPLPNSYANNVQLPAAHRTSLPSVHPYTTLSTVYTLTLTLTLTSNLTPKLYAKRAGLSARRHSL